MSGRYVLLPFVNPRRQRMRGSDPSKFGDRLSDAQKARQAMLEKARAKMAALKETQPERDAERARIAAERAEREEKLRREAEEKAAAEAARLEAVRREAEERDRAAKEEKNKLAQLLADQKAARDARYAARKARVGKR